MTLLTEKSDSALVLSSKSSPLQPRRQPSNLSDQLRTAEQGARAVGLIDLPVNLLRLICGFVAEPFPIRGQQRENEGGVVLFGQPGLLALMRTCRVRLMSFVHTSHGNSLT